MSERDLAWTHGRERSPGTGAGAVDGVVVAEAGEERGEGRETEEVPKTEAMRDAFDEISCTFG
jgi:hypothetical protein